MRQQHLPPSRQSQSTSIKSYHRNEFKCFPFLNAIFVISFLLASVQTNHVVLAQSDDGCFTPCALIASYTEVVPGTACSSYSVCANGQVVNQITCGAPLIFDPANGYCNFASAVTCPDDPLCGTENPSVSPSELPSTSPLTSNVTFISESPTLSPAIPTVPNPTVHPTSRPVVPIRPLDHIQSKKSLLEKYVLVAKTASGITYPSIRYTFDGLTKSLQKMGVDGFGADFLFYLGDGDPDLTADGLINLAAFLANAMVESIQYDSCDENNWQQVADRYAISNSCGQEGRSYQDEECGEVFSCKVDPDMEMTAVTSGNQVRAPPPLKCKPGSGVGNYAGYWDTSSGSEILTVPYSNTFGRTDTEGCCWWGRGAILTRGVCNIGKFNYYLGKHAADRGEPSLYPDIDFCTYPEATCASAYSEELRWTMALFEWAERIQRYDNNGWEYMDRLRRFLDGGMTDDSFFLSVCRIMSRGCHATGCSNLDVLNADARKANFYTIVNDVFDVKSLYTVETSKPTPKPSSPPTLPPTPPPVPTPLRPPERPPTSAVQPIPKPPAQSPPISNPLTPNPTQVQKINPSPILEEATYLPTYITDELIEIEDNDAGTLSLSYGIMSVIFFVSIVCSQLL